MMSIFEEQDLAKEITSPTIFQLCGGTLIPRDLISSSNPRWRSEMMRVGAGLRRRIAAWPLTSFSTDDTNFL